MILDPASLAVWEEIYQWPVDSPHKGPIIWKVSNTYLYA